MTNQNSDNLTDKQRHWLEHIQACETSGISLKAYAMQQGIEVKTLYHWKKALVKKGVLPRSRNIKKPAPVFQRTHIIDHNLPVNQWRIRLPNGIQIGCHGVIEEAQLAMILKVTISLS